MVEVSFLELGGWFSVCCVVVGGQVAAWSRFGDGFICSFIGIDCWHPDENKVLNIKLGDMELKGEFPLGVAGCSSLTVIRRDPCEAWELHFNILILANNNLSGQIPAQIGLLSRMETFNVSNNNLTGPIPTFSNAFIPAESYVNNAGLCGNPLPPCRDSSKKTNIAAIVGATFAGSAVGIGIWIGMFFYLCKASRKKKEEGRSKGNIIGLGRTGTIYKAVLEDGTCLNVKRLQGFCTTQEERLLVYKHMSNGSLHDKLHLKDGNEPMDWLLRLKIAIGTAKGLAWLHHICNPHIIHRNISSNCILLDVDCEPKILYSGLASLMNSIGAHLGTRVNGEFGNVGYVAPEYFRTLLATPKGDVYSFGVMLLELVTGERPTKVAEDPERFKGNIVDWIFQLSGTYKLQDAIDQFLVGKGYDAELSEFLNVACSCVLTDAKDLVNFT
ncbi:unnamed protein product [Fraxinus pennsylvanica]|uniref:Protein kinase domain-containing protein n=1 Tax=Fraxinus pennsylvanica TaxID=56036 RepID=A0AAD2E652_9LAMI|nr:unnamed protein product [Fraxinus pennsylvanica]